MAAILTIDADDEQARRAARALLDSYGEGIDQANKATKGWNISFTEVNQAIELGVKIVAGFKAAINAVIGETSEWANELSDLAEATGDSTERLQGWRFAAEQSGISTEGFDKSLQVLTQKMSAARDAGGETATVFDRLGISILNADGTLRPATVVMGEAATKLSSMANGAEKNAAAMELFGKTGGELVPMLNLGAAGIEEMAGELDRLGLKVSAYNVGAANAFSENVEKMTALSSDFTHQLQSVLAPAFQVASDAALQFSKEGLAAIDWDLVKIGAADGVRYLGAFTEAAVATGAAVVDVSIQITQGFQGIVYIFSETVGQLVAKLFRLKAVTDEWNNDNAAALEARATAEAFENMGAEIEKDGIRLDALQERMREYSVDVGAKFHNLTEKMAVAVEKGATGTHRMAQEVEVLTTAAQAAAPPVERVKGIIEATDIAIGETEMGVVKLYGEAIPREASYAVDALDAVRQRVVDVQQMLNEGMWSITPESDLGKKFNEQMAKSKGFAYSGGRSGAVMSTDLQPSGFGDGGGYGFGDATTGLAAAVQAGVIHPGQAQDLMTGRASSIVGQRFNEFQASMAAAGGSAGGIPSQLKDTARVLDDVITRSASLNRNFQDIAKSVATLSGATSTASYRAVEKTQDFINRSKRDGMLI